MAVVIFVYSGDVDNILTDILNKYHPDSEQPEAQTLREFVDNLQESKLWTKSNAGIHGPKPVGPGPSGSVPVRFGPRKKFRNLGPVRTSFYFHFKVKNAVAGQTRTISPETNF